MGYKVIGKCSCCGGRVTVPTVWLGVFPPVPQCVSCGAVSTEDHLSTIRTKPQDQQEKLREILESKLDAEKTDDRQDLAPIAKCPVRGVSNIISTPRGSGGLAVALRNSALAQHGLESG